MKVREYPQMKLRLPPELKEQVESVAKENGRSMNAEIVHRLESSFLNQIAPNELLTPSEAKAIAKEARQNLYNVLFSHCVAEINNAAKGGSEFAVIHVLSVVGEDYFDDESAICIEVINPVMQALTDAGYKVEISDESIVVSF